MKHERGVDVMEKVTLKYGGRYNVQNQYADRNGNKGYLDVYGGFKAGGHQGWGVTTAKSSNRDSGTGSWRVLSQNGTKKAGDPVCSNDLILLQNQYTGGAVTYLMQYGLTDDPKKGVLEVKAGGDAKTGDNATIWKVICDGKEPGTELSSQDVVHLENQYLISNSSYSGYTYLDTYGSATETDFLFDVYTNKSPDRAKQGTGSWVFVPAPLIKWTSEILDVKFNKKDWDDILAGKKRESFGQIASISNNSPATVEQTVSLTKQEMASFEFSMDQTLSGSVTATGSVGVPGVASAEASVSISLALAFGQRWVEQTMKTYEISQTVQIKAYESVDYFMKVEIADDARMEIQYVIKVSATDLLTNRKLVVSDLVREIRYTAFDGTIVGEDTDARDGLDFITVILNGSFLGTWGVRSDIVLTGKKIEPAITSPG